MNPSIPLEPPREWFAPPVDMPKDAGCIVESNGRIYGYLAHWGSVLHDGSGDRWKVPRSKTNYGHCHPSDALCADGSLIKVAGLGGDAGHAPISDVSDPDRIAKLHAFYNGVSQDSSKQLARVRYGEDANGVWFAGVCWPTVTDLDMARLRGTARSGHWVSVVLASTSNLSTGEHGEELVGACLVTIPGFKSKRLDRAASGSIGGEMVTTVDRVASGGVMVTTTGGTQMATFTAGGASDLPLYELRDYEWDSDAADQRIRAWASSDGSGDAETIDWAKYRSVHFWYDPENDQEFGGYKLLFADVFDDAQQATWKAVVAVASVLQGGRGGVDIPEDEVDAVKSRVAGYYARFAELFMDDEIVPPWEQASMERIASSGTAQLATEEQAAVNVGGILLVEGAPTEDGRLIEAGAAEWREMPLPLYATLENLPGHDAASLVGRIDAVWRDEKDKKKILYSGVVFPSSASGAGQAVLDAIQNGMLTGISIDGIVGPNDSYWNEDEVNVMSRIVVAGATLVPMPAMQDATVTLLSSQRLDCGMPHDDEAVETPTDVVVVEDSNDEGDQWSALNDKIDALADRVEFLIGLVESAQMSARYEAANAKVAKS